MTLQSSLNRQAINMLPMVKQRIDDANDFDSNQMVNYTIRRCLSCDKPIDVMGDHELVVFQEGLIEEFEHYGWYTDQDSSYAKTKEATHYD